MQAGLRASNPLFHNGDRGSISATGSPSNVNHFYRVTPWPDHVWSTSVSVFVSYQNDRHSERSCYFIFSSSVDIPLQPEWHGSATVSKSVWEFVESFLERIRNNISKKKERIVLREIHLRTTGRHLSIGSHSITCYPTEVTTSTGQVGTRFIDPVRMKG